MSKVTRNVKSKAEHVTVSVSINKTLVGVIGNIIVSEEKSRSLVFTELIEEALLARGIKVNYEPAS